MLDVEAATVRLPKKVQVRFALAVPPKPQDLRLSAPLPARQPLDLHEDHRAHRHGGALAAVALARPPSLGVQPRPSPDAHRPVIVGAFVVFCGRRGPRSRVLAGELPAVPEGSAHGPFRWGLGLRVEGAAGVQPDQDLGATPFEPPLQPSPGRSRRRTRTKAPPHCGADDSRAPVAARPRPRWRPAREGRAWRPPASPRSRARRRAPRRAGRPSPPRWAAPPSDAKDGRGSSVRGWSPRRTWAKARRPRRRPAFPRRPDAGAPATPRGLRRRSTPC